MRRSKSPHKTKRNNSRIRKPRGKKGIKVEQYVFNPNKKKKNQYVPINAFYDLDVSEQLYKNIQDLGYVNPTEVQDKTIDLILNGKDVYAIAQTGTGKTAAYLIPLIELCKRKDTYKTIILVPTRELTGQIKSELTKLIENIDFRAITITGKQNINTQRTILKKKHNMVIATPGRMLDLMRSGDIELSKYNKVVVDEVDRMLDMGFLDDIRKILHSTAQYKQLVYMSATTAPNIEKLVKDFSPEVTKLIIHRSEPAMKVLQDIVVYGKKEDKIEHLHDVLLRKSLKKALVFVNKKETADLISEELIDRGFKSDVIHGDRTQARRRKAIEKIKQGKIKVLVATDVAARGLDIDDITHVINYDEPLNYNEYVHRIGRTGRAGKTGQALTFVKHTRLKSSKLK
jgi:ATP-dependent RNA helicase RhlE